MTKKVRLTSLATAVVMFLTMSGANIKKVNDYNGEHIEFSIVQTAEAESGRYFLYEILHVEEKNLSRNLDVLVSPVNIMMENLMGINLYFPEVYDLALTPEEKDALLGAVDIYNDRSREVIDRFYLPYTQGVHAYNKVVDYICDYLSTLEPVSKKLTATNGEELYSQTKRLYIECKIMERRFGPWETGSSINTINSLTPKMDNIILRMETDGYDLEANFKSDYKEVKAFYEKAYNALMGCYKQFKLKTNYNKDGVKVQRRTVAYEEEAVIEDPVDFDAYFPYAEVLDPFTETDQRYLDQSMAKYAMVWAGCRFLNEGTLQLIIDATGYDPNSGASKYYWDTVNKDTVAGSGFNSADYKKIMAGFHEFTTYFEQYLRINHIERPELIAGNSTQMKNYARALRVLRDYLCDLLGTYCNNPDLAFMFGQEYIDLFETYDIDTLSSPAEKYEKYIDVVSAGYALVQQKLVQYCTILLPENIYQSEYMIPSFEEPSVRTK